MPDGPTDSDWGIERPSISSLVRGDARSDAVTHPSSDPAKVRAPGARTSRSEIGRPLPWRPYLVSYSMVTRRSPFLGNATVGSCTGAFLMAEMVERRVTVRESAIKNESSLSFGSDAGVHRITASIVNISSTGALIRVTQSLALDRPLRLRIDTPVKTDWVEVIPIRLGQQNTVAIMFRERCRDDFLWAAVLGLDFGWVVATQPGSSSGDEDGPSLLSPLH